jgi:hypothetical protein
MLNKGYFVDLVLISKFVSLALSIEKQFFLEKSVLVWNCFILIESLWVIIWFLHF